ncbi:MAG: hypothetical protein IKC94_01115 [Lentisphaeria bacterium]|nr:hypothetical protein [Lentisphaeria bacterium]
MLNFLKFPVIAILLLMSGFLRAEILIGNAGVPGNSTQEALNRLEADVIALNPTAVIILLGTNDALNPAKITSVERFGENLSAICRQLQAAGVQKVIFITPFPAVESILRRRSPRVNELVPPPQTLEEYMEKYGDEVKRIAALSGATVIDSFEFFRNNGGAVDGKDSLFRTVANSRTPDGIHLTAAGYEKFAAFLSDKLSGILTDGDRVVCFGDSITYGVHVTGAGGVTGDTCPAHLWRKLNPGSTAPSALINEVSDGNILRNGSLDILDRNHFPVNWKYHQKDQDTAVAIAAGNGQFFLRLTRNSRTPALIRTVETRITPGRYRISLMLRGRGELRLGISTYHPVRHTELKKIRLSGQWQTVSADITIPRNVSQITLSLRVSGQADIDNAAITPLATPATATPRAETPSANFRLDSGKLSISFAGMPHGATIVDISNAAGKKFINFPTVSGLWSIRLKSVARIPGLPPVTAIACDPEMDDSADSIGRDGESAGDLIIDASSAVLRGAEFSVEKSDREITFHWRKIDLADEKGVLDVSVSAEISTGGGIIFRGNFENRSRKRTVFYFNFPQISGLGKINGDPADDFLATPHYLGRLINNPASGKLLNGPRLFRSNNSGHSMHFDALYSRSGDGLFFGVWDPAQNCKRWDLTSDRRHGFSWSCVHLPDNMIIQVPQRWMIPYTVEILPFAGDWYDAAQIYRQWSVRQEWCSKGTLSQRRGNDIPAWFLDTTMWLHVSVENLLAGQKLDCERYFSDFQNHKIAIWLTHWGVDNKRYDFPTPDRFPLTDKDQLVLTMLKNAGYPVSGYIQLTGWTRTMPSFRNQPDAEKNLLRNFYGQILSWGGTGYRKDTMLAYPGTLWQNVLRSFVGRMARSGFQVAYLDSGNHGGAHLNFTPECSATSGGGHDYVDGNRALMTLLRNAGRQINPDFCITTESFWEGNLHCLDAVMCVNSPSAYLEGDRVTAIPLAPAVYHDYALLFATHYGRGDLTGNAAGLIAKTSQALLWGIMPGWELPHAMYRFSDPQRVLQTSKRRMEAYDAGRKFLQYGKMLRPPQISGDNPMLDIPWGIGWREAVYTVRSHAVTAAAYTAPDGTLGIILYNQSEKPHEISVALDDPEYASDNRIFQVVYPADCRFSLSGNTLTLNIPPQIPIIIEGK